MSVHLQARLVDLRRNLLAMGAEVESRVAAVVEAMRNGDVEVAQRVRSGDDEIDRMQLEIENECMRLLALGQPVASDLRTIVTVLRMSGEFERIADLAKGVAKRILKLSNGEVIRIPESLLDMGTATRNMVSAGLSLVANPNLEGCLQLRRDDKRIDQFNKEVLVWSRDEIHRNVDHTQAAIDILAIAQRLERMADISTNVAEDLIFLIEGRIVRHGAE
ncbi:MAG: phosphate signaling complex protein PhoU [Phycisphaerae bacterium]|jgi:phosphate transport system protein|nr:phosphate signaling complex protein PhoU [Phycisphaerae bacterium]